jgi:hypothetical protein
MLNKLTITVHSFVDLITNSSTEIYICAGPSTVKSLKEMVNAIIKLGGNDTLTADDLFTFELGEVSENSMGYQECTLTVKANVQDDTLAKKAADILSNLTGIFDINAAYNG